MARIMLLILAGCSVGATAFQAYNNNKAFLSDGMNPSAVAHMLAKVEDEWTEQSNVFVSCKEQGISSYEGIDCKEAPKAFLQSCDKVTSALYRGSSGKPADTKEYMNTVCSQPAVSKAWYHSTCETLAGAVVNQMSFNDIENRDNVGTRSKQACDGLWKHFVEEQEVIHKKEAAERKIEEEQEAKAAAEEKKVARVKHETEMKAAAEAAKKAIADDAAESKAAQLRLEEAKKKLQLEEAAEKAKVQAVQKAVDAKVEAVKKELAAEDTKVAKKKIIPHMPGQVDKKIVAEKTEKMAEKVTKKAMKADNLPVTSPPLTKEHLTQKMPLESQEQGFEGKMVQHEDGKSMVKDWRREYGPKSSPNTKHEKSSSTRCGLASAVVLAAALHFWQ